MGEKSAVRLDRFLADAGCGTRSEVKKLVRQGRVVVNGEAVRSGDLKICQKDIIFLDGKELLHPQEYVYYLLHKPAGYISATEDSSASTVLDLIPKDPRRRLFPVGRLDKDTEGLLLITDDGALAHHLLSPVRHVPKTYFAIVDGILTQAHVHQFRQGIDIGDVKKTLPAELEILDVGEEDKTPICQIRLTLHEGRYHQVKRMVEAAGARVRYLKRISMGNLTLPPDLEKGQYRVIEKPIL